MDISNKNRGASKGAFDRRAPIVTSPDKLQTFSVQGEKLAKGCEKNQQNFCHSFPCGHRLADPWAEIRTAKIIRLIKKGLPVVTAEAVAFALHGNPLKNQSPGGEIHA
jgi:hypothetical protein